MFLLSNASQCPWVHQQLATVLILGKCIGTLLFASARIRFGGGSMYERLPTHLQEARQVPTVTKHFSIFVLGAIHRSHLILTHGTKHVLAPDMEFATSSSIRDLTQSQTCQHQSLNQELALFPAE